MKQQQVKRVDAPIQLIQPSSAKVTGRSIRCPSCKSQCVMGEIAAPVDVEAFKVYDGECWKCGGKFQIKSSIVIKVEVVAV